jgi:hypothetical protein
MSAHVATIDGHRIKGDSFLQESPRASSSERESDNSEYYDKTHKPSQSKHYASQGLGLKEGLVDRTAIWVGEGVGSTNVVTVCTEPPGSTLEHLRVIPR